MTEHDEKVLYDSIVYLVLSVILYVIFFLGQGLFEPWLWNKWALVPWTFLQIFLSAAWIMSYEGVEI